MALPSKFSPNPFFDNRLVPIATPYTIPRYIGSGYITNDLQYINVTIPLAYSSGGNTVTITSLDSSDYYTESGVVTNAFTTSSHTVLNYANSSITLHLKLTTPATASKAVVVDINNLVIKF